MTDMTIKAIRTNFLRVPWPDTPWLKGHAFGDARNLLVLEVETAGGIVGMGYLFSFRPGLKTIAAALEETEDAIGAVIGAGGATGAWGLEYRAAVSRPLIRRYIRCFASGGTFARWPIRLRIWWTLATSARLTSDVRHFFSYSVTSSGPSSLSR